MNILKDLQYFAPRECDGYIEFKLPVAIKFFKSCLLLRIRQTDGGYEIFDDGYAFDEKNEDAAYYFELYKNSGERDYGISLRCETFYKEYPSNFNINVAINEFVRFFIYLDDFLMEKDIH